MINSGFMKKKFSQLPILFPDRGRINMFGEIVNTMNAERTEKSEFFYVFYRRKGNGDKKNILDVKALVGGFTSLANKKYI